MITVKRAAKRIEAGLGGDWNARDYAYVENIIRDVVVTKDNEIKRLLELVSDMYVCTDERPLTVEQNDYLRSIMQALADVEEDA